MIYKRGRFYTVKFMNRGRVIVRSTKATRAKDARAIESKIRNSIALAEFGIFEPKPSLTLREFITKQFLPFADTKIKPKTMRYYDFGSKMLLNSELSNLKLSEITDQQAGQFASSNAHLSPATINCGLRTLRRAIYLAVEWGKLHRKPKLSFAAGERQRERVLTAEEIGAYLEKCPQPWKDVATIILGTGMRPQEVFALRWENISFEGKGAITITEGKSKAARRRLPIIPEIRRIFMERSGPKEGWVFPSDSEVGHHNQGSGKKHHAKVLKESGVKPFEPYTLRHTALTHLGKFFDAYTLARIAGHSSIIMTARYIHPQADAIESGFERMLVTEGSNKENTAHGASRDDKDKQLHLLNLWSQRSDLNR